MGMLILFILLIYKFIRGTFEYEKVTRVEMVLIPAYSAIMMIITLNHERSFETFALALILLILGIIIGIFQASKLEINDPNNFDRYHRPIIKVKRNWPYLLGWIIVFIIGIALEMYYGTSMNSEEISHELFKEILRDLSVIALIHIGNSWFIWVLNVATSFTYELYLIARYPKIRLAIRAKK